jgi:hypothetical protein
MKQNKTKQNKIKQTKLMSKKFSELLEVSFQHR